MYDQSYEDYMRSILGYPRETLNTYNMFENMSTYEQFPASSNYSDEIMDLYPDIYKLINPMVCKICESNTKPITRELLDQMTQEIYLNIENIPEIETNINVRVNVPNSNKELQGKIPKVNNNKLEEKSSKEKRKSREDRQRVPNRNLEDLIRILILNQLLGINRPPRPRPPRPPYFPGRPPFPREDRYYNGYF